MRAGLHRFGTDFGHGRLDGRYFQLDCERPRYLQAKRDAPPQRRVLGSSGPGATRAREAAQRWIEATLEREAPHVLHESRRDAAARDPLDALARALQEDLCVLWAGPDAAGSAVLIDVRFPSGWRPERLRDADFQSIHAPVPGFASDPAAAKSLVRSMVERGPFVRFVWTLVNKDQLDQHPDRPRLAWEGAKAAWLRVERQVTVPLSAARASVFLIRVYHYALSELSAEQQVTLLSALEHMPHTVRQYKHLPPASLVESLLSRAPGPRAQARR